jgi:hypothetical protein
MLKPAATDQKVIRSSVYSCCILGHLLVHTSRQMVPPSAFPRTRCNCSGTDVTPFHAQSETIKQVRRRMYQTSHVFSSALKGAYEYCATVKINTFKYLQNQKNRKFVNYTVIISIHHITATYSYDAAFSKVW